MNAAIFLAILTALASLTVAQDCNYDAALCTGRPDGSFHPSPTSCQNWIQCADNDVFSCGLCNDGLYFDPVRGGCTYPSLADCETAGGGAAQCSPGLISRVPHPESCTVYYQCLGQGTPIEHSCAEGLHFDKVSEKCDFIDNVRCMREPVNIECPATDQQFTQEPHPWVCDLYFMCINGVATELQCLPGMHFDVNLRQCQVIAQAECILDGENPTDPGEPTDPQEPTDPDPEVPTDPEEPTDPEVPTDPEEPIDPDTETRSGQEFVDESVHQCADDPYYYVVSYPNNCQKYIQCIYGDANLQSCVDGTLFSPETLRCEMQEKVACA